MWIIEWVISVFLLYAGISTLYLLFFSLAGKFTPVQKTITPGGFTKRVAVLIPAYKEDAVIVEIARQALHQSYPAHLYDVVVIADSLQSGTLQQLKELPVLVLEVQFDQSTKAKALNAALQTLPSFDRLAVLDADNIMAIDFLEKVNTWLDKGYVAVQGHRTAKNTNTSIAILDAISEEINNHIFRKGHQVAGLSAALIGSGMGFEYQFFKDKMLSIKAVGGFDKELEMRILLEGKKIYYVEDAIIYDEKVQNTTDFKNQRTRWITAQINYLQLYFFKAVEQLIFKGNLDFFNKILQTMLLPRILLLGLLCINTLITMLSGNLLLSGISFGTTALLLVALLIAIPRHLLDRIRLVELLNLPVLFLKYAGSLMNMKAARKKFIHTPHGHLQ